MELPTLFLYIVRFTNPIDHVEIQKYVDRGKGKNDKC